MIPIFASEKRAAELLDMPKALFRRLVDDGLLPRHVAIGGEKRWDVDALKRAVRGEPESLSTPVGNWPTWPIENWPTSR